MNIGEAAALVKLAPKTIRYYEEIGLVVPDRGENGYRHFDDINLDRLGFVGRARSLGFSIPECRQLLGLYSDEKRASRDVKALAAAKICEIDDKIVALQSLRAKLGELAEACAGDKDPDCPILDGLAKQN